MKGKKERKHSMTATVTNRKMVIFKKKSKFVAEFLLKHIILNKDRNFLKPNVLSVLI